MLNVSIPRNKYKKANYPNLEDRADGIPIPELWGLKTGITPVCIDTTFLKYKYANRAAHALNAVRADDTLLVAGTDYTSDLANAEFTILGSPFLAASTTYYFVLSGTWAINGVGYLHSVHGHTGSYADGVMYTIDASNVWTADPEGGSLGFKVYGRQSITGEEELMLYFDYEGATGINIRDVDAHTRLAQSFKTGAAGFFLTRITIVLGKDPYYPPGQPVGTFSMRVLSSISPETQIGTVSGTRDCGEVDIGAYDLPWAVRGAPSKVEVDAEGMVFGGDVMENVADIIEDSYSNVVGGNSTYLDTAVTLPALKIARTQKIAIFLDREITYNIMVGKLEAGQMFKVIPDLDGKFETVAYTSGAVGAPHFYDEDFISFSMTRSWKSIFQAVKVKYDESPSNQEFKVVDSVSTIAEYLYKNKESLTVETYLRETVAAQALADDYIELLQYPLRIINFEVGGFVAMTLIPSSKVRITRSRADYTNGVLSGILFRVIQIDNNILTGVSKITAILDVQTYPA
jgi:hypothetical protein